jgi:DNA invertase Pin-like site-specific DNA recombinase
MTTASRSIVAYLRVSTEKQGHDGLGIHGQRSAVREFAARQGHHIIAEFVEVESGKVNDRHDEARIEAGSCSAKSVQPPSGPR